MSFKADGPVGQKIKPILKQELINRFNLVDESDDVSEFLLVLIADNKTPPEIVAEIKELVDAPIDEGFINMLFGEIKNVTEQMQAQAQVPQMQQDPQLQQPQVQQPQVQDMLVNEDSMDQDKVDFRALPDRPNKFKQNNRKTGGVGKQRDRNAGKRSTISAANMERALGGENTKFVAKPPKGRCHSFPNCHNRDCRFAHPTKVCKAWPGCQNPPGTCNFLHPDEDQELMAKLEVSKQEYLDRKKRFNKQPEVIVTGITLCKYGQLCSKEICPFGHPTPANIDAKVIDIVWCEDGKNCTNGSCRKAHPSPGYLAAPVEARPPPSRGARGPVQKVLEQCKFGMNCTNFNCARRHATSTVPCREGANCQRIDCTFAHPIDEDCRFGEKCTNKTCMYRHPEGRNVGSNTWVKDQNTDQRAFAVPEDQVMERAEQPSMVQ